MQAGVPRGLLESYGEAIKAGSAGHRGNDKTHIYAGRKSVTHDRGFNPPPLPPGPRSWVVSPLARRKEAEGRPRWCVTRGRQDWFTCSAASDTPRWFWHVRIQINKPGFLLRARLITSRTDNLFACIGGKCASRDPLHQSVNNVLFGGAENRAASTKVRPQS